MPGRLGTRARRVLRPAASPSPRTAGRKPDAPRSYGRTRHLSRNQPKPGGGSQSEDTGRVSDDRAAARAEAAVMRRRW
ncbi:hypothetical protein GCM10009564_27540 [Streptomyces thermogriseus]|uniref:Uncharacterized protein n=1 Tax=Streptomyces thermogriseus TaxID=75292 RepID=A0ABN1SZV5_9ACTN